MQSSSPDQAVKQRPSQHKTAQATDQLASPQIPKRSIKVILWPAFGTEGEYECGYEQRAYQVEGEARVRFEA
jgi:hypothetical protein